MSVDDTVDVALILWGENLVLQEVTDLVGMPPTHSRAKGENPPERPSLRPDLLEVGMWSISTMQQISSQNLSDHLAFLVEKVDDKITNMKEKGLVDKARLLITVHVGAGKPGVASWEDELDAELVANVARLGVSIAFTVMWPLPE